jgi:hypothetical protein
MDQELEPEKEPLLVQEPEPTPEPEHEPNEESKEEVELDQIDYKKFDYANILDSNKIVKCIYANIEKKIPTWIKEIENIFIFWSKITSLTYKYTMSFYSFQDSEECLEAYENLLYHICSIKSTSEWEIEVNSFERKDDKITVTLSMYKY